MEQSKETDALENKWFQDNPNPQKYVTMACDGHYPKFECRLHHKQCYGACTCGQYYQNELSTIEKKYQQKKDACENAYQTALANQRQKEEKVEAEKKEKEQQQKKNQEKENQSNDINQKEINDSKTNKVTSKEKTPEELLAEAKAAHFKSEMDLRRTSQEYADQENQSKMAYFSSVFGDFNFKGSNPLGQSNYMMNISIGIPAGNVPLYTNSNLYGGGINSNSSSTSTASSLFGYYFGAELHLLNNKFIDLHGFGSYYGSITSIGGTTDGSDNLSQFYYGGELGIGYKRLKFYGGYAKGDRDVNSYSHTYNEFLDADFTTSGLASYNFTRYIGGICYHFDDAEKERYMRLNFIKEVPEYNKADFIWGAGLVIRGWLTLEGEYFPFYPSAGVHSYSLTDDSKKSLWQFSLSKTITLFNGRY